MAYNTSAYPYDTIVYITDTIGDEEWQGSGVLISPDEVLTASHVVYTEGVGTATDIVVTPGYSAGTSPYGSATGTYVHYFPIDDAGGTLTGDASQYDYAVIHLSRPFTTAGTMGLLANFNGGTATVSGYPALTAGTQVNSGQTVTRDPVDTLLDSIGIGDGSSGGPVWVDVNGKPEVVGLVSTESETSDAGYDTLITTAAFNQIEAWVAQDDAVSHATTPLAVTDTTANQTLSPSIQSYTGPVAGLQQQYVDITSDNLNIVASTPGWFIHSGSGTDAIQVSSGTNVLDGGTGSNFLTGGSDTDTFFVDDRGASANIWSTVNNFHAGDSATIWGVTPTTFSLQWTDGEGAAGYTGLTLHATATGMPTASLTLVGFSQTDLANGQLSVSFSTEPSSGSSYMYVHANS